MGEVVQAAKAEPAASKIGAASETRNGKRMGLSGGYDSLCAGKRRFGPVWTCVFVQSVLRAQRRGQSDQPLRRIGQPSQRGEPVFGEARGVLVAPACTRGRRPQ